MLGSTLISVPRADWQGTLHEFVEDNRHFMPDYEMERIVKCLKLDGHSTHKAASAGEFNILLVKEQVAAA